MIGYIDASIRSSIQLHETFGFRQVGLSAVDRIQIRPLDGFGDHAAFARARGHKPT